jgi:glycosyltransferase involved in cell wall biosynthesis
MRRIADSTFVIAWNGAANTPPSSAVREFLLERRAMRVVTIHHPLMVEDGTHHRITIYERGRKSSAHAVRLPFRPPYTYVLDPFVPPLGARGDCWIAFNNLMTGQGLVQRVLRRTEKVIYWPIDFVPDRFGTGLVTRVYDCLDAYCCRNVDARFEVTQAALDARNARHRLVPGAYSHAEVLPIGAWSSRVPIAPDDAWHRRRVVFAGHLVERQGVAMLLRALAELKARGVDFTADLAGHGPLLDRLRSQSSEMGLDDRVTFVGFIGDPRDLARFIASGSVAVAPYDTDPDSFSRFADPGKLRVYTAGGLPVILTDVPPNAAELAAEGGAEIVACTAEAIADGIARALDSPQGWQCRREAALAYASRFDWEVILERMLSRVGFES